MKRAHAMPFGAPRFFDDSRHTPWGGAIDFDGEHSRTVRDFFVHNALYWLEEFHFDGLRTDAVHAIADRSSLHLVANFRRQGVPLPHPPGRALHAEGSPPRGASLPPWSGVWTLEEG